MVRFPRPNLFCIAVLLLFYCIAVAVLTLLGLNVTAIHIKGPLLIAYAVVYLLIAPSGMWGILGASQNNALLCARYVRDHWFATVALGIVEAVKLVFAFTLSDNTTQSCVDSGGTVSSCQSKVDLSHKVGIIFISAQQAVLIGLGALAFFSSRSIQEAEAEKRRAALNDPSNQYKADLEALRPSFLITTEPQNQGSNLDEADILGYPSPVFIPPKDEEGPNIDIVQSTLQPGANNLVPQKRPKGPRAAKVVRGKQQPFSVSEYNSRIVPPPEEQPGPPPLRRKRTQTFGNMRDATPLESPLRGQKQNKLSRSQTNASVASSQFTGSPNQPLPNLPPPPPPPVPNHSRPSHDEIRRSVSQERFTSNNISNQQNRPLPVLPIPPIPPIPRELQEPSRPPPPQQRLQESYRPPPPQQRLQESFRPPPPPQQRLQERFRPPPLQQRLQEPFRPPPPQQRLQEQFRPPPPQQRRLSQQFSPSLPPILETSYNRRPSLPSQSYNYPPLRHSTSLPNIAYQNYPFYASEAPPVPPLPTYLQQPPPNSFANNIPPPINRGNFPRQQLEEQAAPSELLDFLSDSSSSRYSSSSTSRPKSWSSSKNEQFVNSRPPFDYYYINQSDMNLKNLGAGIRKNNDYGGDGRYGGAGGGRGNIPTSNNRNMLTGGVGDNRNMLTGGIIPTGNNRNMAGGIAGGSQGIISSGGSIRGGGKFGYTGRPSRELTRDNMMAVRHYHSSSQ